MFSHSAKGTRVYFADRFPKILTEICRLLEKKNFHCLIIAMEGTDKGFFTILYIQKTPLSWLARAKIDVVSNRLACIKVVSHQNITFRPSKLGLKSNSFY